MVVIRNAGDILFTVFLAILIVKLVVSFKSPQFNFAPGQKLWIRDKQYTITELNIGGAGLTVELKMERTTMYEGRKRD